MFHLQASSFLVALSFDTKNNLYYSRDSKVSRFNNTTGAPVLWHDFLTGRASGDFVMKNGKMYISWETSGAVDLLEIVVDNNINYISHKIICRLKSKTFGLASELGQLYGVTPTELYKIDDLNCQYKTVMTNTASAWYGAAGFHEAQNSATVHLTYTNAISLFNPIAGMWANTIPHQQTIYVTINDQIKDSLFIYPIKIKIIPKKLTTVTKTICKGSSYEGYTTAGIYSKSYIDGYGCDSVHRIHLQIVDTVYNTLRATLCQGQQFRGYTSTGTYRLQYKTPSGCDSIVLIELIVHPVTFSAIYKTICSGKSFLDRTTTGIFRDTLTNIFGCDSFRTLHLSVVTISKPLIDKFACINPHRTFRFYSQIISIPGLYIDSTNHKEECDTIFRLHVSLQLSQTDTLSSTHCQGYTFKGIRLYSDTMLKDTIRSILGCDSMYRSHNIRIQKLLISYPKTIYYCDSFHYRTYSSVADTTVKDTLRYSDIPYCDSLRQTLIYTKTSKPKVTIYAPSGNYCLRGESINIEAKGAHRYLWNTTETSPTIKPKPDQTTTYLVRGFDQYNCSDTASIEIEVEDLVYFDLPSAFSPNADGENDLWSPNSSGQFNVISMDIFNRWGEKVFAGNKLGYSWDGNYHGSPENSGVFTFYILVEKNRRLFERKGSFTLIR